MTTDTLETNPQGNDGEETATRRDVIHLLAGTVAAGGAAAVVWPMIQQMNPDASVLALSSIEVDLSSVPVGSAVKVIWQKKPVFIRHRTPQEIEAAEAVAANKVPDGKARNDNLSGSAEATDENRRVRPEWMIVVGVCTHLGCIPLGTDTGDNRGDYNGWFCPCHGSHYDTAGRVRKGPAPENLLVPPYEFITDSRIKIG